VCDVFLLVLSLEYSIHTHTYPFNGPLSGWAGTSKVQSVCILLKQETVGGSGISWAICKPAPRSRQITTPAPHCSVFYRPDALPATQPTASKHWRHMKYSMNSRNFLNILLSRNYSWTSLYRTRLFLTSAYINVGLWFWPRAIIKGSECIGFIYYEVEGVGPSGRGVGQRKLGVRL